MSVRWEHVAFIDSDSQPDEQHEIKRRMADGHLGCDCGRYRFAKKAAKTCHHIEAYLAGEAVDARPVVAAVRSERVRVKSAGEMYTVTRRAITFGSIPAGGGR